MKPVIVSAHNPMTGPRHLGHYVSTMIDWKALQGKNELIIIIDDLIASLLYPRSRKAVTERALQVAKEFIATGVDFDHCSLVLTSMIPEAFELAFFASQVISQHWCQQLYEESFAGLLDSYQRREIGLMRSPSVAEVSYPQLHLAALTLGLGATGFQGGEEMRGYMGIMEEIAAGMGRQSGLKSPSLIPGRSMFLVGTDGQHMGTENALYLSDTEANIGKAIRSVKRVETLRSWAAALGRKDILAALSEDETGLEDARKLVAEALVSEFAPFRESKTKVSEITDILEASSVRTRETVLPKLVEIKRSFGIPGYGG